MGEPLYLTKFTKPSVPITFKSNRITFASQLQSRFSVAIYSAFLMFVIQRSTWNIIYYQKEQLKKILHYGSKIFRLLLWKPNLCKTMRWCVLMVFTISGF